jgi:hypothetical protein
MAPATTGCVQKAAVDKALSSRATAATVTSAGLWILLGEVLEQMVRPQRGIRLGECEAGTGSLGKSSGRIPFLKAALDSRARCVTERRQFELSSRARQISSPLVVSGPRRAGRLEVRIRL